MSGSLAPHILSAADAVAQTAEWSLLDAIGDAWVSTAPTLVVDRVHGGYRLTYETAVRVACTDRGYEPAPHQCATRDEARRAHQNAVEILRTLHRDIPLRYVVPVQPVTQEVA